MQFQWDPALETGSHHIDEDHRQIFDLANRLAETVRREGAPGAVNELLAALAQHADEHFDREEEEMERVGYPEFDHHVLHHDQLRFMLRSIVALAASRQDDAIRLELARDTVRFLDDWVHLHIDHFDRRFADFVRTLKRPHEAVRSATRV